ncbi:MAG TPA: antibiotic biosynthesis monooxygenase [Chloroflexia bacterium]|nr:antibiotic biosynthesis monooxygenase [Chloroflexia bacterium]
MYVRLRRVEVVPGTQEEARRIWQEQIIPNLQQQKGFRHVYVTSNLPANLIVIIFLWESQEDAEVWLKQAATQQLLVLLAPLTAAPPLTEEYQLVAEG